MLGPSSRVTKACSSSPWDYWRELIELGRSAFLSDASTSDKRAWLLRSRNLRANPPIPTRHETGKPTQAALAARGRRLARRARAVRIRRSGRVIRDAGPKFQLLGPKTAAAIEGAQLPAERPGLRPGSRPPHRGHVTRPAAVAPDRIAHGCHSQDWDSSDAAVPRRAGGNRSSFVRQGDIPDGRAKSKELFKKTSPAVDIAPLLPDALARFTRSGRAIESLAATQAV